MRRLFSLLLVLSVFVSGCSQAPQVRSYIDATDPLLTAYLGQMDEFANLNQQVTDRMSKVDGFTPELAVRMGTDLELPLSKMTESFKALDAERQKVGPAPKAAKAYERSVNGMFQMLGEALAQYSALAAELKKGEKANVDQMARLNQQLRSTIAAATHAAEQARTQRQELEKAYPPVK